MKEMRNERERDRAEGGSSRQVLCSARGSQPQAHESCAMAALAAQLPRVPRAEQPLGLNCLLVLLGNPEVASQLPTQGSYFWCPLHCRHLEGRTLWCSWAKVWKRGSTEVAFCLLCVQVWGTQHKKGFEVWECVQTRATKLANTSLGLQHESHEELLRELGFFKPSEEEAEGKPHHPLQLPQKRLKQGQSQSLLTCTK